MKEDYLRSILSLLIFKYASRKPSDYPVFRFTYQQIGSSPRLRVFAVKP